MASATLRYPGDGLRHPWSVLTRQAAVPAEPTLWNRLAPPSTYITLGVLDLLDELLDFVFAFPARRLFRDEWDIDVEAGGEWRRISVHGFANAQRKADELQAALDAGGWSDLDEVIAQCVG